MTPEQTREAAAVMLAFADGKKIQAFDDDSGEWYDVDTPMWDWTDNKDGYRVAPEPWTGKLWVHPEVGIIEHQDLNWKLQCPKWRLITAKEVGDE